MAKKNHKTIILIVIWRFVIIKKHSCFKKISCLWKHFLAKSCNNQTATNGWNGQVFFKCNQQQQVAPFSKCGLGNHVWGGLLGYFLGLEGVVQFCGAFTWNDQTRIQCKSKHKEYSGRAFQEQFLCTYSGPLYKTTPLINVIFDLHVVDMIFQSQKRWSHKTTRLDPPPQSCWLLTP